MISTGTVLAYEQDVVPDAAGLPLPGITFSSGGQFIFGDPQMDAEGNVLFRARLSDGGQALNDASSFGYFYGTNSIDLRLALRGGEAAPGIPGATFDYTNPGVDFAANPFVWEPRLSSDGTVLFYSYLAGAVTPETDRAFFSGTLGASSVALRAGDIASGTGGATFQSLLHEYPHGTNASGDLWFTANLTPGTGTPPVALSPTESNGSGLWAGAPNALELVLRSNTPLSGNPALVITGQGNVGALPLARNDAGLLLYWGFLSRTSGATPATLNNDEILAFHVPGVGSTIVAREGSPVPGLPGVNYGGQLEFFPGLFAHATERSLLSTGEIFFLSALTNTATPPATTEALLRWNNGAVNTFAARNTPAAGTNGFFGAVMDFLHNSAGTVAVKACYTQVGLPDTQAIWVGTAGNLALVVQDGQLLPGTGGGVARNLDERFLPIPSSQISTFHLINSSQLLFSCTIEGGSNPGRSLWTWQEGTGLLPILLPGDLVTLPTGGVRQIAEHEGRERLFQTGNGDGMSPELSAEVRFALRVRFTDGTAAIMTTALPRPFESYCAGDGGNPTNCPNCPCGNQAAPGSPGGCLNSQARSAELVGSGSVRVTDNNLRFDVTGASSNTFALLASGDNRLPAMGPCPVGSGLIAFDGLRCAGGALLRHGSRAIDANGDVGSTNAGWGGMSAPITGLIAMSGFTAGQTRNFQAFYRDDPTGGCLTGQNSTNAVAVTFY